MMRVLMALCAAAVLAVVTAEDTNPINPGYSGNFYDPDIPPDQIIDDPIVPPSDDRPMLGVQMSPPSRRVIVDQGIDAHTGVYVHRVYEDTAAAQLGVQRGDVITAINGSPIGSMTDLREIVLGSQVGDDVDVMVRRNGEDVLLNGGSYQTWPEAIPFRPLDASQEERYRQLQQRRMGQQMRQLDRLAEQHVDLAEEMARLQENGDLAEQLGLDNLLPTSELPKLPGGALPSMIPEALLALPAWRFHYGFAVAGDGKPELAAAKVEIDDLPALPEPAPVGGTSLLSYSFDISSEVY